MEEQLGQEFDLISGLLEPCYSRDWTYGVKRCIEECQ